MAQININTSSPNDGLGETLRAAITSINTMFTELYGTTVFKEAGKGLTANDFTATLLTKLNGIAANAELNVQADLLQADSLNDSFIKNKDALLPASPLSVMTGLSQGGVLTINADNTKFDLSAGIIYVVDGHSNVDIPTVTRISFTAKIATVIPNITSTKQTHVAIDINGNLYLTPIPLTATERRNYVKIGVLIHLNNTNINYIDNAPAVNIEAGGQIQDILESFGFRSLSGNRIRPVGTNLKIKKDIGRCFKPGANFANLATQPHSFILAAQEPITFKYRTQTGVELASTTDINPAIIDINGTFTPMPSTATFVSVQKVFIFQDGVVVIQPGQKSFVDMNTAINNLNSDIFILDTDIENNSLYLGAIAMTRNNVNLSTSTEVIFIPSNGTSVNGSAATPALGYTAENAANKQNSLTVDGTGSKYPTVDAVNANLSPLSNPTFTNSLGLAENSLGTSLNRIKQVMAGNDVWSIFGEAGTTDQGICVFEVGDNGGPFSPNGQKFEFRYINVITPAENKVALIIDYNLITVNGDLKVTNLSGTGVRNIFATADGTLVPRTTYPIFADNAAANTGGLLNGEFYRTSTGALFVKF